jgi:uncharacterized cupin superfamily protein
MSQGITPQVITHHTMTQHNKAKHSTRQDDTIWGVFECTAGKQRENKDICIGINISIVY